jgi:hypothetical protein
VKNWLWFVILVWLSFVVAAFFYNGQPFYAAAFTVLAPLLALYVGAMARLFSKRLAVRSISIIGAVLLLALAGGEAWIRHSSIAAGDASEGLLPSLVKVTRRWKDGAIPAASPAAATGQITPTPAVDNRAILDHLSALILDERCRASERDQAALRTGWQDVLMPYMDTTENELLGGKVALANAHQLLHQRVDIFGQATEAGKVLIQGMGEDQRAKVMQQFVSAQGMIIQTQRAHLAVLDTEWQNLDHMLDIRLGALKRHPANPAAFNIYTPAEVARWNALLAQVRAEDVKVHEEWGDDSYAVRYADHQLDDLVKPGPASPPRSMVCPLVAAPG